MKKRLFGTICAISLLTNPLVADSVDMRSKLTVRGEARLFKAADQMTLAIGVISQAESADTAVNDNSKVMAKVIAALKAEGVKDEELQTGRFSIDPVWSSPPKGSQDSEWAASIIGYRAANSVNLKTSTLDKGGKYIQVANSAGANSIGNIQFGMKDARSFQSEAITAASNHAMADARTLADSTHQKLVRLLDVSLDSPQFSGGMRERPTMMMAKSSGFGAEVPINPGQVEISASVSLIYEIAP